MPSDEFLKAFLKRFDTLEKKVDRMMILGVLILGASLGAHHMIPKIFEFAAAMAGAK